MAHAADVSGKMPNIFGLCELKDFDGLTVAHKTAIYGKLPANFSHWTLKDNKGQTVVHLNRLKP